MGDFNGIVIATEETITALSEVLDREPAASPERCITLLTEAAAAQGLGAPMDRGLPEVWHTVVETLRRRKVRQMLGPFEVPTQWMSFHVPPGGKGQLKLANKTGSEYGLKLKAVGCGWGSGHGITVNINRDFQERARCIHVALALQTRVTLYEGDVLPRADVLGVAGLTVEEWAECPDCSGIKEHQGAAMVEPAGEWIDLRRDPTGQTVEITTELVDKDELNLSMPFKLPNMDVQIGIDWSRRAQLTCSTKYQFPGGRRYRPCASYGEPADLPYWRWE